VHAVTWAARVATLLPLAALLVACGRPSQGDSPPPPPVSTPRPAAGVVALLDAPLGSLGNTVRVLRADGAQVSAAPLPDGTEAVALAGTRVLVAGGGRLSGLDAGGGLRDLGSLGDDPDALTRGLVASPDGHRWMWASVSQDESGTVHDTLRLAGDGMPPHTVLTRTESGAALQPVAWTGAGVVVADEPLGIGGYVIFRREFGPTSLLDPVTATLRPLLGDDCAYSDSGPTGSTACIVDGHEGAHGNGPVTLHLISAGGGSLTLSLPGDIAQAGAAWFSPDGGRVTLASSPALANDSEVVHCMVLDAATARSVGACPDGLIPAGWLGADSFAAFRTPSTGGGEPGTYVVHGDGTATRIASGSQVVGTSSAAAG
jgi:hypothetical protein